MMSLLLWFLSYCFGFLYIGGSCVVSYVSIQYVFQFILSSGCLYSLEYGASGYDTFDIGRVPFSFGLVEIYRVDFRKYSSCGWSLVAVTCLFRVDVLQNFNTCYFSLYRALLLCISLYSISDIF